MLVWPLLHLTEWDLRSDQYWWSRYRKPASLAETCTDFPATDPISVGWHIWILEVKELVKLHNLRVHFVLIQSELKFSVGVKVAGTIIRNSGPGSTWPNNGGFLSGLGTNPTLVTQVRFYGGSWPGLGASGWFQPRTIANTSFEQETTSAKCILLTGSLQEWLRGCEV